MSYWLFKSEPGTYSFADLLKDEQTHWNGVRNFQARNYLLEAKPGDSALIYHSGDEKAVVGVARIVRGAYPDPDPKKPGDWVQIDLAAEAALPHPVTLREIKANRALDGLLLVKQSRLSCMPITGTHFKAILKMGRTGP